jgi:tetratricopeptide (TPR) repeat protein
MRFVASLSRLLVIIFLFMILCPALSDCKGIQGLAEPKKGTFNEPAPVLSDSNPVDRIILKKLEACKEAPDNPKALMELGDAYMRKDWLRHAEGAFKQALKVDHTFYPALNELGALYLQAGESGKAEKTFRKALKIMPGFAPSHYNLGRIYLEKKNIDGAVREFALAYQIDPRLGRVATNPVVVYNPLSSIAHLAIYMEESTDTVARARAGYEKYLIANLLGDPSLAFGPAGEPTETQSGEEAPDAKEAPAPAGQFKGETQKPAQPPAPLLTKPRPKHFDKLFEHKKLPAQPPARTETPKAPENKSEPPPKPNAETPAK